MPKQQRMMRVEQRSQLAAMQQLECRSDEELEAETRYKAAAQAILGARAAERYDAKAARAHFQRAIAARPAPRSGCSCAGWPTRRWRWPNAAPTTSRRRPSGSGSRRRPTASFADCGSWA